MNEREQALIETRQRIKDHAMRTIFVRFQKEGIHCYPAAATDPALATGDVATERIPAVNAVTATSAIRFLIVNNDIFFLSLVEIRYFLISARRSFDPLFRLAYDKHVQCHK